MNLKFIWKDYNNAWNQDKNEKSKFKIRMKMTYKEILEANA